MNWNMLWLGTMIALVFAYAISLDVAAGKLADRIEALERRISPPLPTSGKPIETYGPGAGGGPSK